MSERQRLEAVTGPVSRETWDSLQLFMDEFRRWSARINLAAPSTLPDLFDRHILDSAQLLALAPDANRWLDLGSGGGFPGAVVAILLKDRVGSGMDLVESNRKKAAFLTNVLGRVGAPARVHACRIEDARHLGLRPEIVTARALAPVDVLLELAAPWLNAGARGLFHKGRNWREEIRESGRAERYDLVTRASVVDPGGVILEVTRKGDGGEDDKAPRKPSDTTGLP